MKRPRLLVLVRHGESERNEGGLAETRRHSRYILEKDDFVCEVPGRPNHVIGLTELGKAQAKAAGRYLFELHPHFDVAYHSGFHRANQTLQIMLREGGAADDVVIKHNDFLRERNPGYTYYMSEEEVDAEMPYFKGYYEAEGHFLAVPPGGESQSQVCDRAYLFLGRLFEHRAGENVLVVAHGGSIRAIRYRLEKWTRHRYEEEARKGATPNCGITTYMYVERSQKLELISADVVAQE